MVLSPTMSFSIMLFCWQTGYSFRQLQAKAPVNVPHFVQGLWNWAHYPFTTHSLSQSLISMRSTFALTANSQPRHLRWVLYIETSGFLALSVGGGGDGTSGCLPLSQKQQVHWSGGRKHWRTDDYYSKRLRWEALEDGWCLLSALPPPLILSISEAKTEAGELR